MNIIVVLLIFAVLGGGGYYLFITEQAKSREEKRIADTEAKLKDTTKFSMYSECDYLGYEADVDINVEEGNPSKAGTLSMDPMAKSMIIPKGFTVDTYTKPDKGGIKISYSGPTTSKCLSTPIPHVEWRKE